MSRRDDYIPPSDPILDAVREEARQYRLERDAEKEVTREIGTAPTPRVRDYINEIEARVRPTIAPTMRSTFSARSGTMGGATRQSIEGRIDAVDFEALLRLARAATGLPVFVCAARRGGGDPAAMPADCDWPICGCDPYAGKVISALQESDLMKTDPSKPAPVSPVAVLGIHLVHIGAHAIVNVEFADGTTAEVIRVFCDSSFSHHVTHHGLLSAWKRAQLGPDSGSTS